MLSLGQKISTARQWLCVCLSVQHQDRILYSVHVGIFRINTAVIYMQAVHKMAVRMIV